MKIIEGHQLQKATLNFSGRNWVAWFSRDLVISNGPDIFSGLPGLIFEIYDSTNSYHFNLIGLKKEELIFWENPDVKANKISVSDFSKILENHQKNPIFEMEAMGAVIDAKNRKKIMKAYEERKKRNNNIMELKPEYD